MTAGHLDVTRRRIDARPPSHQTVVPAVDGGERYVRGPAEPGAARAEEAGHREQTGHPEGSGDGQRDALHPQRQAHAVEVEGSAERDQRAHRHRLLGAHGPRELATPAVAQQPDRLARPFGRLPDDAREVGHGAPPAAHPGARGVGRHRPAEALEVTAQRFEGRLGRAEAADEHDRPVAAPVVGQVDGVRATRIGDRPQPAQRVGQGERVSQGQCGHEPPPATVGGGCGATPQGSPAAPSRTGVDGSAPVRPAGVWAPT